MSYEAVVTPGDRGGFDVTCPDLVPGVRWAAPNQPAASACGAGIIAFYANTKIRGGEELPKPQFGRKAPEGGFVMGVTIDIEPDGASLPGYCTVAAAAEMLHVSTSRIRALARAGGVDCRKHGGVWYISLDSVRDRIEHPRRPGRPSKTGA